MKKLLVVLLSFVIIGLSNIFLTATPNTYSKTMNKEELHLLASIVEENLSTVDYSYEVISSFNSPNRYVLVELEDQGYLIYDRYFQDYCEYSLDSPSPYTEALGKKIYFGPTYYFTETDNLYYDVFSQEVISEVVIKAFKKQELININNFTKEKAKCEYEALQNKNVIMSSVNTINTDYFRNLNNNIGTNTTNLFSGSCAFVAYGIILSYYDSNINDRYISETFDVIANQEFDSLSEVNMSSYTESPGIFGGLGGFHNFLLVNADRLGIIDIAAGDFSSNFSGVSELNEWYAADIGISITPKKKTLGTKNSFIQYAKDAIDSGYPVYISITGGDGTLMSPDGRHAVVGYDYNSQGIFVHFGHRNRTRINIKDFTINYVGYFEVSTYHSHSYNYKYSVGSQEGYICSCNHKHTCTNFSYYVSATHPATKHKKICLQCNESIEEKHQWVHYPDFTVCSLCGYISGVQPYALKLRYE